MIYKYFTILQALENRRILSGSDCRTTSELTFNEKTKVKIDEHKKSENSNEVREAWMLDGRI